MVITAIVFDLGGVLLSWANERGVDQVWEERLGLPSGAMASRVWSSSAQAQAVVGEIPFEEFWRRVGDVLGLNPAQLAELNEDCQRSTQLNDTVATWVQGLRPKYRLACLSNAWSDARREVTRRYRLDRLLDLMVFSAEEGVAKPDPRIYEITLERLGVSAEQALFIDDRVENVNAALSLGMHAFVCVTRTWGPSGPEQLIQQTEKVLGLRDSLSADLEQRR